MKHRWKLWKPQIVTYCKQVPMCWGVWLSCMLLSIEVTLSGTSLERTENTPQIFSGTSNQLVMFNLISQYSDTIQCIHCRWKHATWIRNGLAERGTQSKSSVLPKDQWNQHSTAFQVSRWFPDWWWIQTSECQSGKMSNRWCFHDIDWRKSQTDCQFR